MSQTIYIVSEEIKDFYSNSKDRRIICACWSHDVAQSYIDGPNKIGSNRRRIDVIPIIDIKTEEFIPPNPFPRFRNDWMEPFHDKKAESNPFIPPNIFPQFINNNNWMKHNHDQEVEPKMQQFDLDLENNNDDKDNFIFD